MTPIEKRPRIAPMTVLGHPVHLLSFGLGGGLSPYAPGTLGTLLAIPLYLLMAQLSLLPYLLITLVMLLAGIWMCAVTARNLGVHDHSGIVWDEVVGYLITMTLAPPGWLWVVIGFALFRLFDIWKPWPIRWADRKVHGGFGIMLDDVLAAIYAGGCLVLGAEVLARI